MWLRSHGNIPDFCGKDSNLVQHKNGPGQKKAFLLLKSNDFYYFFLLFIMTILYIIIFYTILEFIYINDEIK